MFCIKEMHARAVAQSQSHACPGSMQAQGQEPALDPFEQLERSLAAKAAASRSATAAADDRGGGGPAPGG